MTIKATIAICLRAGISSRSMIAWGYKSPTVYDAARSVGIRRAKTDPDTRRRGDAERSRQYYIDNRDRLRAQRKAFREANHERVLAQERARHDGRVGWGSYRTKFSREELAAKQREYRASHPERERERGRRYQAAHKDDPVFKAKERARARARRRELLRQTFGGVPRG